MFFHVPNFLASHKAGQKYKKNMVSSHWNFTSPNINMNIKTQKLFQMGCSMIEISPSMFQDLHLNQKKTWKFSGVSLSKVPLFTSSELPCPVAFHAIGGEAPRVQQHQRQTQQHVQGAAQAVAIDAWIKMASRCICASYLDMYISVCVCMCIIYI